MIVYIIRYTHDALYTLFRSGAATKVGMQGPARRRYGRASAESGVAVPVSAGVGIWWTGRRRLNLATPVVTLLCPGIKIR